MVSKIDSLISDESLREKLNADKKRKLTDLVKIIKALLSNREFNDEISHMIRHLGIESKLWLFSDCTNYEF
jgi:urease gamma subunit